MARAARALPARVPQPRRRDRAVQAADARGDRADRRPADRRPARAPRRPAASTLELTEPARELIAREGYDPVYGARPAAALHPARGRDPRSGGRCCPARSSRGRRSARRGGRRAHHPIPRSRRHRWRHAGRRGDGRGGHVTDVAIDAPDLPGAKLTVRRDSPHSPWPWQATARVLYEGRVLAAHASGRSSRRGDGDGH